MDQAKKLVAKAETQVEPQGSPGQMAATSVTVTVAQSAAHSVTAEIEVLGKLNLNDSPVNPVTDEVKKTTSLEPPNSDSIQPNIAAQTGQGENEATSSTAVSAGPSTKTTTSTASSPRFPTIYHVTDVNVAVYPSHPTWHTIQPYIATDAIYDGILKGLPVTFFTTGLFDGGLPTRSMYPSSGTAGETHHRVTLDFNPDLYDMYLVHQHQTRHSSAIQYRVVCISKTPTMREKLVKLVLDKIIEGTSQDLNAPKAKDIKILTKEDVFPGGNERNTSDKQWYNFAFVEPVNTPGSGGWDSVLRMQSMHDSETCKDGNRLECLQIWCLRYVTLQELCDFFFLETCRY
eukprot:c15011_g1_i1.p1 GENE.c15011_g1_i1~~c15011_g1_i1.p1  ORF type:complete len:353 (+),score=69.63 c15011_g1_i1:27-1061(+)